MKNPYNMKNIFNNKLLWYTLLALVVFIILKYLYDTVINRSINQFRKKQIETKRAVLSNNYLNLNKPIYNNDDYKDNITCNNPPGPVIDGGIRVNYYNAGRSLLL